MLPTPRHWSQLAIRLVVVLAVLLALDRLIGAFLNLGLPLVRTGESFGIVNVALTTGADVLVLGSSRALHGYDDEQLSRSLGLRVHNAANDGRGVYYARGLLSLVNQRHAPRLVVVDIMYFPDDRTRAGVLSPFYRRSSVVDEILVDDDWRKRTLMTSHAYRFNGLPLVFVLNAWRTAEPWGFRPLGGKLDPSKIGEAPPEEDAEVGPWLAEELGKLVDEARAAGSEVVFVESPCWSQRVPHAARSAYERVASSRSVPFLHFLVDEIPILQNTSLFRDVIHLNAEGARIYSELFAKEIHALVDGHTRH